MRIGILQFVDIQVNIIMKIFMKKSGNSSVCLGSGWFKVLGGKKFFGKWIGKLKFLKVNN